MPTSKGIEDSCSQCWVRGWAHSKPNTNSSCNGEAAKEFPFEERQALLSLVYLEVSANAIIKGGEGNIEAKETKLSIFADDVLLLLRTFQR